MSEYINIEYNKNISNTFRLLLQKLQAYTLPTTIHMSIACDYLINHITNKKLSRTKYNKYWSKFTELDKFHTIFIYRKVI